MKFDLAWLREHEAKMAAIRGEPVKPPPLLIEFSIPVATRLPNRTQGQHWSAGVAYRAFLLPLVDEATKPWRGHQPIERARVTITRHSTGVPDEDNLWASVKPLCDLLLVKSKRHPHSLGLIRDDDPNLMHLSVLAEKSSRKDQRTAVRIEAII